MAYNVDKPHMITYTQALQATLERISPLGVERVALLEATGRVCAEDIFAQVDSPSADVSFKDGYAIHSAEIAAASPTAPVRLEGEVSGQADWTQFVMGRLERSGETFVFQPLEVSQRSKSSRLLAMAAATGVLAIPEGTSHIPADTLVTVYRLALPA